MTKTKENILGTESIGKLLAKFAIPGIVSMVVNSFYNIVDQIFIGRGVGFLGNGATTVIFPMTTFAMAFALLFGDGAAAFLSLRLGEKQPEKAAKGCMAGIIGFCASSILLTILYLIFWNHCVEFLVLLMQFFLTRLITVESSLLVYHSVAFVPADLVLSVLMEVQNLI